MRQMKSICSIDALGRILIPKAIRKELSLFKDDQFEITCESGAIVLKKIDNTCIFCGSDENLSEHNNKFVCKNCINELLTK